ncbi:MFS general substrate transporter [Daldinia caldariorum]|uniref:MFS general substrate transporter n=1 Tax=Daldinia caldariorum TaxID=326644 RepID=UPI0020080F70|nr:MFS general substrate transporter [Daldinia caldariorum]KAI1470651.1 MFS general substrate transporter [Daldinia caldariorum]
MAASSGQTPEITMTPPDEKRVQQSRDATAKGSSSNSSTSTSAPAARGDEEQNMSPLERVKSKFGDRPECFKNTFQEISFIFQATIATATTSFLNGVALVITVPVARDLGMTQGEIAWISAATSLVAGALQLALGQLADLLGRKPMFIAGLASFSAFALLLAFSQNPFWMLIVCGILGACSAMVVPPAIGILGAAYATPSKRKNLAFSAFSSGNPLGFVFGTIVCGIVTQLSSWRAAFIVLCVVWALFTIHAFWAVPNVENFDRAPLKERLSVLKQFDIVGTILTISGTGLFTAGLTLGPEDGWSKAHVIAMLIVGIVLLVMFALWERVFPNPQMPPYIWKDWNFSFIILSIALGNMGFTASGFWVAFFFQEVRQWSTLVVAVHLLPMAIAGLLWNIVAGRILHSINNTAIMIFGAACYLIANILLSVMKIDTSYWASVFPALILLVAGADFQFNVGNMYVMESLPKDKQSLAGGIFNVVIRLANTAVMGASTAVFSSVQLTPEGMADPMLKFTRTFQMSIGFSAACLIMTCFIRLGTQGNSPSKGEEGEGSKPEDSEDTTVIMNSAAGSDKEENVDKK